MKDIDKEAQKLADKWLAEDMEIRQFVVKKFMVCLSGKTALKDVKINTVIDLFTRDIVVRLDKYMWKQDLETKKIRIPLDWIEAFKERWLPEWLKERYPVRYKWYIFEPSLCYPELMLDDERSIIKVATTQKIESPMRNPF